MNFFYFSHNSEGEQHLAIRRQHMQFEELEPEDRFSASRNPEQMQRKDDDKVTREGIVTAVQELGQNERYSNDSLLLFSPNGCTEPCKIRIIGFLNAAKIVQTLNKKLLQETTSISKTIPLPAKTTTIVPKPHSLTHKDLTERRLIRTICELNGITEPESKPRRTSWCA